MKKLVTVGATMMVVAGLLAGCGKKDESSQLQDSLKGMEKQATKTGDDATTGSITRKDVVNMQGNITANASEVIVGGATVTNSDNPSVKVITQTNMNGNIDANNAKVTVGGIDLKGRRMQNVTIHATTNIKGNIKADGHDVDARVKVE
jgi:hypothetical protein